MNSLQLTSSLLRLQGHALGDTEAGAQVALAASRVAAVARVHQHLYVGDGEGAIDCGAYLGRLCGDLSGTLRPDQGAIEVEVCDAALPSARIVPLGLVVAELVTNAAKHGTGRIRVSLDRTSSGAYALSVSDEGAGLPPGYDPGATGGLGMRVITTLVGQLHGRLSFGANDDSPGAKFTVTFPAEG
jgi:two-component sensor histidine kinase